MLLLSYLTLTTPLLPWDIVNGVFELTLDIVGSVTLMSSDVKKSLMALLASIDISFISFKENAQTNHPIGQ
jgi:hypothetical protein